MVIHYITVNFKCLLNSYTTLSNLHTDLDFTNTPQPAIFPVGSSVGEQRCISILLTDDVLVEVPESFSVTADSNDPNVLFTFGGNAATVTITDNDSKKFAD